MLSFIQLLFHKVKRINISVHTRTWKHQRYPCYVTNGDTQHSNIYSGDQYEHRIETNTEE